MESCDTLSCPIVEEKFDTLCLYLTCSQTTTTTPPPPPPPEAPNKIVIALSTAIIIIIIIMVIIVIRHKYYSSGYNRVPEPENGELETDEQEQEVIEGPIYVGENDRINALISSLELTSG